MCYTPKNKAGGGHMAAASGSGESPPASPTAAAASGPRNKEKQGEEEANVTIIDSERKTTDAYDEDLKRTDTPGYILALAPWIDTLNWGLNPVMYSLAYVGECLGWGRGGEGPTRGGVVFTHCMCAFKGSQTHVFMGRAACLPPSDLHHPSISPPPPLPSDLHPSPLRKHKNSPHRSHHPRTHPPSEKPKTVLAYQLYSGDWLSWRELAFGYVHSYWRFIMGWGERAACVLWGG